tara:strand:- start:376 stop:780 length:405 start_codon:yes stop_codon:yes gene_type:complete
MQWFIKCIKKYIVFKGRASRTEFWNFMLFWVIFYVFVVAIDKILGGNYVNFKEFPFSNYIPLAKLFEEVGLLTLMYRPLTLLPSLAAISRRLHDINKSGWWCLTCVTPFIIILIFFLCKKGDEGTNRYGIKPTQ